jgi:hypothetical protein
MGWTLDDAIPWDAENPFFIAHRLGLRGQSQDKEIIWDGRYKLVLITTRRKRNIVLTSRTSLLLSCPP